jgi:acylphosphatase
MKNVVIIIHGKVRHKGFRFAAMQKAYQLNVRGFIKNQADSSLYVEAEGEESNLDTFIEWCKVGPIGAQVTTVDVTEGSMKDFKGFDMK